MFVSLKGLLFWSQTLQLMPRCTLPKAFKILNVHQNYVCHSVCQNLITCMSLSSMYVKLYIHLHVKKVYKISLQAVKMIENITLTSCPICTIIIVWKWYWVVISLNWLFLLMNHFPVSLSDKFNFRHDILTMKP